VDGIKDDIESLSDRMNFFEEEVPGLIEDNVNFGNSLNQLNDKIPTDLKENWNGIKGDVELLKQQVQQLNTLQTSTEHNH
jgi:small-conductance mechanosensitive channel